MKDQAANLRVLAEEKQGSSLAAEAGRQGILVVLSGKGGVGKSFLSLHIAQALTNTGGRVLLVDSNRQSPNLHVLTNTDPAYPIDYWMKNYLTIDERALISLQENLDLLANVAHTRESGFNFPENAHYFLELFRPLAEGYNYIVMDTQTGLNQWNLNLLQTADLGLLVSIADPTSVIDTYMFIKASLPYLQRPNLQLIVNQVLGEKAGIEAHQNLNLALNHFLNYQIELLGTLPFDMDVREAGIEQKPLWEKTRRGQTIREIEKIARAILDFEKDEMTQKTTTYQEVNV